MTLNSETLKAFLIPHGFESIYAAVLPVVGWSLSGARAALGRACDVRSGISLSLFLFEHDLPGSEAAIAAGIPV
jgi:hypothetical protein